MMLKSQKKIALVIFATLTLIFLAATFFGTFLKTEYCGFRGNICKDVFNFLTLVILISPVFLVTSLLFLKSTVAIFRKVMSYTLFYFIGYFFIVLVTPWDMGNGLAGPSFSKGFMALSLCIFYLLGSTAYFFSVRDNKS
jgi:hypothetical protein